MDKPRGRAALMQHLKNSIRRPGETEESTSAHPATASTPVAEVAEAPKPRGRADLMKKLKSLATSTPGTVAPTPPPIAHLTITDKAEQLQLSKPTETFQKGPKGTSGTQIGIAANYIHMIREKDTGYHKYEVKFAPAVDSKSARCKLIRSAAVNFGDVYNFNGVNDLYLPVVLPQNRVSYDIVHPFNPEETIEVTIIYKLSEPIGSKESLHFLNVLFKRIMNKLKMVQIQRNYFDFSLKTYIPQHALEVIPGYAVAVDEREGGLMICLDTCHKLLRKKSVCELFAEIHQAYPSNFKEKCFEELLGQTVLTTYNNKNYVVNDIIWDITPRGTFETSQGPVSYIDYYKNHYGVTIRNLNQPMLMNMVKKKTGVAGEEEEFKIMLVPELCNLTGISQDQMTHQFKKDMAEHTRLPPAKRFDTLAKYINNVRCNPEANKILSDWGLSIGEGVIDLNARVLTDDKLTFKSNKIDVGKVADWGRDISRDGLIRPVDMTNWIVLCPDKNKGSTDKFVKRIRDLSRAFGCTIAQPRMIGVGKGTDKDYRDALEANSNDSVQIFLIIVPVKRDSLYRVIKATTLARKGILGQVALVRTIENERIITGITQKLGMQMQAKLGGALWTMVFPSICDDFMFVGMDTFHSKGQKKSVGAIVASIDVRHTNYYTGLAFQAHEIADALKLHFIEALNSRRRTTGRYPTVVFMVRDGVGDGQLQSVKDYEMQQYLNVREEIGCDFKLCFLVIQKRINTRLKLRNGLNPPGGTVIDHTITRCCYEDFFMVPQSTRIGTVSPAHYIVLHNDTTELNLERIQKLSFKLCHMYYNWTGPISVPAPCQYAHKAAYLVGEHMERKPLDSLNEKLYYL